MGHLLIALINGLQVGAAAGGGQHHRLIGDLIWDVFDITGCGDIRLPWRGKLKVGEDVFKRLLT